MEDPRQTQQTRNDSPPGETSNRHVASITATAAASAPEDTGRRRSGSGGSILSKFPFMRTSDSKSNLKESRLSSDFADVPLNNNNNNNKPQRALATALSQQQQQQKTRRRKGSLRKVALLGRGAARDRRDLKPLAIDTVAASASASASAPASAVTAVAAREIQQLATQTIDADTVESSDECYSGLGISDATPRPSMDGFARRTDLPIHSSSAPASASVPADPEPSPLMSPTISYTSTTDEEDGLSIPVHRPSPLHLSSLSSSQESFFQSHRHHYEHHHHLHHHHHHHHSPALSTLSIQRRREASIKHAKSPLSLTGLAVSSPLPAADEDHDYGETERWGWVVLAVTWFVFVVGMGSCLNVWRWAWDVDVGTNTDAGVGAGTSSYASAPSELENDPTLPIDGYYPALIILTCIMAWVWVVNAWIGMKYFRHAKISGD